MAEWTEERCLKLIEAYKKTLILWDHKYKGYYKRDLKQAAWTKLSSTLGFPVNSEQCRTKMTSLLSGFRREKMRIKHGKRPGGDGYQSQWFAYKALYFLMDRDRSRQELKVENQTASFSEESDNSIAEVLLVEPPMKKAKPDANLQILTNAFGIIKSASQEVPVAAPPLQSTSNDNPEIRHFLDFVAEKMKTYKSYVKNSVQEEICKIIFKADQGGFEYTHHEQVLASTSNPDYLTNSNYNSDNNSL